MSFEEAFKIALIPASISAFLSIASIFISFFLNRKRSEKEALYKNKIDLRERLKDDLAAYMGKIQRCYYDATLKRSTWDTSEINLMLDRATDVVIYGYKVKLELNPSRDKNLLEKIDDINEICAGFDKEKMKDVRLHELFNLGYVTLAAMDTEIKRLAG